MELNQGHFMRPAETRKEFALQAVIHHFCCLFSHLESEVLRLHVLHSTPIAVPISPSHPSQTAAQLTQENRPTTWTGSQPGRLVSKQKQEEGAARALRNCLTFQVLLLFLAPCWVHVSFFGYFSSTLCIWKEKLQPVSVTLGEMWSAFTGGI